ncbi:MAG: BatA domain-containing protein, partial [Bryobacteraceae bacterium]
MGLLNPWFLGGLVAVGLPIWLHLLKRHKTDPTPFPSLMFFEHREQSSVQHRRLDYILLFILRTLMLLLLALLFASPYINRLTPKGAGKKLTVVAVDRSFSMRTKEGTSTRLDDAKAEAVNVLSKLPPGQLAQVVALADTLQAMTQQTADPGELRGAVMAIKESDARASFGELARYLRTLRESTKTPLDVHLISDLQKSAMPAFTDVRLDQDIDITFHPVGKVQPNWAVEAVIAPQHVYDPKRARISATVTGFSAPAATRTVTLLMNGKTIQSKSVSVPENGRGSVEFAGLDQASYGFNRCEIRIDSADSLPADDRYAFSVERTDPKKVLFLDDGRHPEAQEFFRAALNATPDSAFQLEPLRPDVAANSDLSKYAVVVLNDLGALPSGLEASLQKYVSSGGSLLEAIGPASAVAFPRVPVLDEPIDGTSYASRENELFFSVSDVDTGHDVMKSVERFDGVKIYLATNVGSTKSSVLARLSNGKPLVLERKVGEGKVLVFTSDFGAANNDLPRHNAWVPFVQKSVAYLGGAGSGEQPTNLAVGEYVELRTGNEKGAQAEVQDPDGQRVLSLEEAAQARNFELTREGFYEVRTAGGKRSLIAAHANRRESDLAVIPQETLELWKATGSSGSGGGHGQGTSGDGNTTPWPLSPYILLLLLGVALAESVIADR